MTKSCIKSDLVLDSNNWCITLIRRAPNHAMLLIEGVGDCIDNNKDNRFYLRKRWSEFKGNYWMIGLHFTGSGNNTIWQNIIGSDCFSAIPTVLFHNLTARALSKNLSYLACADTHLVSPKVVRMVLSQADVDIEYPPSFHLAGGGTFSGNISAAVGFFKDLVVTLATGRKFTRFGPGRSLPPPGRLPSTMIPTATHNCLTWALSVCEYAGLSFPSRRGNVTQFFAQSPSQYTTVTNSNSSVRHTKVFGS